MCGQAIGRQLLAMHADVGGRGSTPASHHLEPILWREAFQHFVCAFTADDQLPLQFPNLPERNHRCCYMLSTFMRHGLLHSHSISWLRTCGGISMCSMTNSVLTASEMPLLMKDLTNAFCEPGAPHQPAQRISCCPACPTSRPSTHEKCIHVP